MIKKIIPSLISRTRFFIKARMSEKEKKEVFDEGVEEIQTIQAITPKELKKLVRGEFEQNYKQYYPTEIFSKIGFSRSKCEKCSKFFWAKDAKRTVCGDSMCEGKYSFIGNRLMGGKEITIADAWKSFEESFTSERIPCTSIKKYPVVARWRNDVDYVAAGIYCFQPFCVTGEMAPPANPLICPQFCVRFNDLDNIGLTGRHYSGFIMIGIQVFNYPNEYHFFKEECVEFNYNWLTKKLGVPDDDITFTEDIWAGGGNMGPSIEYFVKGMEIGNMVFMQFKTFHDGTFEELKIKVIDTGIGLERVAWLVNGSATSYNTTFKNALKYLLEKLELNIDNEIWKKLGPYTCMLDVDECEDIDKTWTYISDLIGVNRDKIKEAIEPIKDMFIILDHTRTAMMIIRDGSLPSNVGGGSNLRNIIRRTFAIMSKNKWWDKVSFEDYMGIFKYHELDLQDIYGVFELYQSFNEILTLEYNRWRNTDESQTLKLKKLVDKKKLLSLEDWYIAVTSWGIPADTIAKISNSSIPDNLYYFIDEKKSRIVKAPERILYQTAHLPETISLYFDHLKHEKGRIGDYKFKAKLIDVFCNVTKNMKKNLLIFDRSLFYPTSGGQAHDTGKITINNITYNVINVEKVGKCVIHEIDQEIKLEDFVTYDESRNIESYLDVEGEIDQKRRIQLRNHHTAAHIVFAATKKVLGPHIWQHGAKKTIEQAHLDVTHFDSLTKEQEMKIQETANRTVMNSKQIYKTTEKKDKAEIEHGFNLYQGGVIPGDTLRVVNIDDTDVEACCGTHCDNTSEVGWIKILNSKRIADGVVRLYFVAGERTIEKLNEETQIINDLSKMFNISQNQVVETADRIFKNYKKLGNEVNEMQKTILGLQVRYVIDSKHESIMIQSSEENPTIYFSFLANYAKDIFESKKNILFIGESFFFMYSSQSSLIDEEKIKEVLKDVKVSKMNVFGNKSNQVKNVQVLSVVTKGKLPEVKNFFESKGFVLLKF